MTNGIPVPSEFVDVNLKLHNSERIISDALKLRLLKVPSSFGGDVLNVE